MIEIYIKSLHQMFQNYLEGVSSYYSQEESYLSEYEEYVSHKHVSILIRIGFVSVNYDLYDS